MHLNVVISLQYVSSQLSMHKWEIADKNFPFVHLMH